ncbi:transcriptional regulator, MarR family [Sulfitobacter marinus]|uniref:Transcriptional regulator, MarR family n=2 Tax=Sulfitobacter marinus TaxID=394264 RepID=A0A1I6VAY4_9RHOB|nr:transcriptional regulator, MarR family [Sulfitobacter marinus]
MPINAMPGHLIRRLHQLSTATFSEQMKAAGIDMTSVQFAALQTIHEAPGIDQARLAHHIAYDRATIGGVVDRLERKGWVTRSINPEDKRARRVALTGRGRAVLQKAAPIISALQGNILSGLSDAECAQFIALAAKAVAVEGGFDPSR